MNLQIKLDHISTHLGNACKEILLGDDPLTSRVAVATVDVETLRSDDLNALPVALRSDVEQLQTLVGDDDKVTQANAVAYASRLFDLCVKVETLRTQDGTKR